MNRSTNVRLWLAVCLWCSAGSVLATEAVPSPPSPCSAVEAGQFDFWVGRWDVFAKGKLVGHNQISRILGGCTLLEEYDTLPGKFAGKSFNYYDESDNQWHQVWVDNSGVRLHLSGRFSGQSMVMAGERQTATGAVTDRITWTDNNDDTVRQVWDVSRDGGVTWQTVFDGTYRPVAGQDDR